jgi:hypothetical protein
MPIAGATMQIPNNSLFASLAIALLMSACATSSGPTRVDSDQWQIVAANYIEAAKKANEHCKSLGQNSLKVTKRQAHEDNIEIIYRCAKD